MRKPIHIKHPGALHRALGVKAGHKIPAARLAAAKHSSNPHMREMANFATNAAKFHHAGHFKSTHRAIPHHTHAVHPGYHVHR